MAKEVTRDADVRAILENARTIAVLGAHTEPARPAFYVPDYLFAHGYRILPVNPVLAGQRLWGEEVRPDLAALGVPVDIVDVFRRADLLFEHLSDLLAMQPLPRVVWLQLGIRNDVFSSELTSRGIEVVQDRCTLADHRRLGIGAVPRTAEEAD